jgi:hypothetical protein
VQAAYAVAPAAIPILVAAARQKVHYTTSPISTSKTFDFHLKVPTPYTLDPKTLPVPVQAAYVAAPATIQALVAAARQRVQNTTNPISTYKP